VKCPVWVTGTLQDGTTVKPKSLNTRNWAVAAQQALEMEAGVKHEAPKVTIGEAIASYQQFKEKRSEDTKRKIKLLTGRLAAFLDKRGVFNVADVKLPDLVAFRDTWTGEASTRRRDQEILKSFFWYCFNADFLVKNPVVHLDPITVERSKTDPFTVEEQVAIFNALPDFPDEYGRRGLPIAIQTKAFVLVLRYTGMAIGDVAKLDKQSVHGRRIITNRKKTGEEVFASVPQFVIDALKEAPHDSDRYFFWSGRGKIHTRTSKWGSRLKKLFVLANVLTTTVDKSRGVAGKLTDETEAVKISMAHPYMFRHTFARDFLESGGSMAELAELLGNTEAICQKHYSKWDKRRQDRLERNIDAMRADDLITKMMNNVA
jgi:site-specific recombinase XerD